MSNAAGAGAKPRVAATLILASIGAFVTSLDVVVVSTALPQLRVHLGANVSDLEWTINAYNLAFASLMLTGAATALVAMIPALLGPSRARALARVADANPILAQAPVAAEAKS